MPVDGDRLAPSRGQPHEDDMSAYIRQRPKKAATAGQEWARIMGYGRECVVPGLIPTNKGLYMQRFGMTLRLKDGSAGDYKAHHREVWPEVLEKLSDCHIRNYSIYLKDGLLFSYFEYHGNDLKADWERMAAHTKTQEWWASMRRLQEPLVTRKEGEWWAEMEEVFHLD
jgi:L-rhamnose mutarotase